MPRIRIQISLDCLPCLFKKGKTINYKVAQGLPEDAKIVAVWMSPEKGIIEFKVQTRDKSFIHDELVELVIKKDGL